MTWRRPQFHLADLVMGTILVGLIAGLIRWLATPRPLGSDNWPELLYWLAISVWFNIWRSVRAMRVAPECADCGRRFLPTEESAESSACPRCRRRGLSPAKVRREAFKYFAVLVYLLLVATFLVGMMPQLSGDAPFGPGDWFILLLKVVGVALGCGAFLCVAFIAFVVVRGLLTRGQRHALARAKKVAGTDGDEVTLGPIALWYSGPTDPSAMVAEQAVIVRHRFDAFTGEVVEARPPIRLLVFERREALVVFHRESPSNLWNLDFIFTPKIASMTLEVVPYRLGDPTRRARWFAAYHAISAYHEAVTPPWLRLGVAAAVVTDGDDSDLLNRRMLVAIERGSTLGVELFSLQVQTLMPLLRGWQKHAKFARLAQILAQSHSIVEYLNGPAAPDDRRGAFRAFYKELSKNRDAEEVFRHHFGHGFDVLIEGWRIWVRERGPGVYAPPPSAVEEMLVDTILPLVADRKAMYWDRVLAIREMGESGFVPGADALIKLLSRPGELPREEIVWALESISGIPLGNDHGRWAAWWDGLPSRAKAARDQGLVSPSGNVGQV